MFLLTFRYARLTGKLTVGINRAFSVKKTKVLAKDFALRHFDDLYGSTFKNWSSIRLALLCPHSYCAVVNSFSNFKHDSSFFSELGAYKMADIFKSKHAECKKKSDENKSAYFQTVEVRDMSRPLKFNSVCSEVNFDKVECAGNFLSATKLKDAAGVIEERTDYLSDLSDKQDCTVLISEEDSIEYPDHLLVYQFPRGQFREFPPPSEDGSGLLNYYLMDGASVLPVLALDIQKGDTVGDLCASPGGKSLAIVFTLKFGKLICNDSSISRVRKMKAVLNSYLPYAKEWNRRVLVSNTDVCSWHLFDSFDKILLDVPCTNDRMSVKKDGNSIFKQERFHERMTLPKTQTDMLCKALQALKIGGSLVYSTCTLSPVQNDGVVHMALTKVHSECCMKFVVKDLAHAFYPLREMFQFSDNCTYGQLVLPFLPLNYGPMYISKICRIE